MIIRSRLLNKATKIIIQQLSKDYKLFSLSKICQQTKIGIPVFLTKNIYNFATDHIYKQKTTKQIQKQIGMQKWKQLQNTFKSLNTSFGLRKPSAQDLQNPKFNTPSKIQYTLETLRQCSQNYPVYLHWELQKNGSPFNQLIQKIIGNLWKAEQKQTMEFLQFLYVWDYKKVDVKLLYQRIIQRFDLSMDQLFHILKMFQGKIIRITQVKVLSRLQKQDLNSNQYSALLKIINYFTVNKLITEQFYIAATSVVTNNINRIPPAEVLEAYIYYTYNISEHISQINKHTQTQNNKSSQNQDLGINLLKIIEKRLLSPQCIKFYNGQQLVALLHTFLKNNLMSNNQSVTQQYNQKINKIIDRISLGYFADDFSSRDKKNLLQISSLLPEVKKQTIIALVQRQLLKKKQKFDSSLLSTIYLLSYQNNMLTDQIKNKAQHLAAQQIFNIEKKQVSRILWLLTITGTQNLNSIHKKVQTIIEGGFRDFTIKDICIIVWSMSAQDYNQNGRFWDNIQSFLHEELSRQYNKQKNMNHLQQKVIQKNSQSQNRKLVNDCVWILWAYHNNRFLKIKIIDLISEILIKQFKSQSHQKQNIGLEFNNEKTMTVFQLTSIISFYYSIQFPSKIVLNQIKSICIQQFKKIYKTMEPIELCKCLKYIGHQIWRDKQLFNNILEIFQIQIQSIAYKDIMAVVAILISSGIKNSRVISLIKKLTERKKRLESLQKFGTDEIQQQNKSNKQKIEKQSKWKFPI